MPTLRLTASSYYFSSATSLSSTTMSNAYTNIDSTTKAQINHTKTSRTSYYVYLRGFDFSQIPSNAIITSAIVKVKAYVSGDKARIPKLYNNTKSISGAPTFSSTIGTNSSGTISTANITSQFETYKGYGNNFGIRFTLNRSNSNTASSLYIYGAEITVEYTLPTNQLMIKDNGSWINVTTVYQKVNNAWVEQTDLENLFDTSSEYLRGD